MNHGANRVIPEKVATHYPVAPILMSMSKEFDMYCKCGCGQITKIAERTRAERGWRKGEHKPYVYRHYKRPHDKPVSMLGKGINYNGYEYTTNHKLVHREIANSVVSVKDFPDMVVHHVDGDRLNNNNNNLVICENIAYHNLLHQRMDAKRNSGDANKRKCHICKEYDSINNMKNYPRVNSAYFHVECSRVKARRQYKEKKCH